MFEDWTRVIGGLCAVAGLPGFLTTTGRLYDEADPELQAVRALLQRWRERYAGGRVTATQVLDLISQWNLPVDLGPGSTRSQVSQLGRLLARHRDRWIGGFRLTSGVAQGTTQWTVRIRAEAPPPATAEAPPS